MNKVSRKRVFKTAAGLVLAFAFILILYSPPGETVRAFNQSNLVRVTEIQEVDGRVIFRRLAPVAGVHP